MIHTEQSETVEFLNAFATLSSSFEVNNRNPQSQMKHTLPGIKCQQQQHETVKVDSTLWDQTLISL